MAAFSGLTCLALQNSLQLASGLPLGVKDRFLSNPPHSLWPQDPAEPARDRRGGLWTDRHALRTSGEASGAVSLLLLSGCLAACPSALLCCIFCRPGGQEEADSWAPPGKAGRPVRCALLSVLVSFDGLSGCSSLLPSTSNSLLRMRSSLRNEGAER